MIFYWVGFITLVLSLLTFDLVVLNKKGKHVTLRAALGWTAFWVSLALVFNVFVYFAYSNHWGGIGLNEAYPLDGKTAALEFLVAYLVEESLSVDNMFVFAVVFGYFRVAKDLQHRVLYWGILGALIMRGIMIALGTTLIHSFDWIIYVFGALLIFTAAKMYFADDDSVEPEKNILVRIAKKVMPVTKDYHGEKFFVVENGVRSATPLFIVLLVIESTDVLFAVDSIPAVFAVTRDPFIVFTSNIFAILGLRALYFALAGVMDRFHYLKLSLVVLLAFIGVKMLASKHYHISPGISLGIVFGILATGVIASIMLPKREEPSVHLEGPEHPPDQP
jgi:tellurite resistance protein TerC